MMIRFVIIVFSFWCINNATVRLNKPEKCEQDLAVNGRTIGQSPGNLGLRYKALKQLLDKYQDSFTVLDIKARNGYFGFKIAEDYPASVILWEPDRAYNLNALCAANTKLKNIMLLEGAITIDNLRELSYCDHFSVVLAFNVIQEFKERWQEALETILRIGDHIFIEIPVPTTGSKELKEQYKCIKEYFDNNEYKHSIGRFAYRNQESGLIEHSQLYLFSMYNNIIVKPGWGSPYFRYYTIVSNFKEKGLFKQDIAPDINEVKPWKQGINLWTFRKLNGTYPSFSVIAQEIKRLAQYNHPDFLPWNMIIKGQELELIDWDGGSFPTNYERCIQIYLRN